MLQPVNSRPQTRLAVVAMIVVEKMNGVINRAIPSNKFSNRIGRITSALAVTVLFAVISPERH